MRYPRVIAHRGGGGLAPENSLAGIRIAARLGCRGVEFDVMLSSDGVPMLMHDETLDRTTDLAGPVASRTALELLRADAGTRHHGAFGGEQVPTLHDTLHLCRLLGVWVNVEIKPSTGRDEETGARVAEMAAGFAGLVLSSFSLDALAAAARTAPHVPRALLMDHPREEMAEKARELGLVGLHAAAGMIDEAWMATARRTGLPVASYTVNDRATAGRLTSMGVTAVITDRPDLWTAAEMHAA